MKTLTKILTTALATALTFNSYSQIPKNTVVAYVSVPGKENKPGFDVDSLKSYDVSFEFEEANMLDFFMKGIPKENKSDTQIKLYAVRKTEKETRVIPIITEGGYDFSKDSKKEIEKQIKAFIKDEKINISDAVKYGSGEMIMEIVGNEK